MTHTCCTWWYTHFCIFYEDDRIEIQEEESADLEELSVLMSEFENAFIELRVPLVDFIRRYWSMRMDQVMSGGDEDEAQRTRELGVVWEPRESCGLFFNDELHSGEERGSDDDLGPHTDEEVMPTRRPINPRRRRHSY